MDPVPPPEPLPTSPPAAPTAWPAPQAPEAQAPAPSAFQLTITGHAVRRFIGFLLVCAVLAAAVYGVLQLFSRDPFGGGVKENRWQAVFLTNNRVYFGHLRAGGGEFYELRDAYFLQQTTAGEGEQARPTQQVKPITEELQGPESRIFIRRDEVLAYENLRRDSAVAKAIADVRSAGGSRPPPQQPQEPQQQPPAQPAP